MESLVAAALVMLLLAFSLPVLSKMRASSDAVKCLGRLRNFGTGLLLYIADHDGLPWHNGAALPASNVAPSQEPTFEAWVRPYVHLDVRFRLRCPLRPVGNTDEYRWSYGGNANLCRYYPKIRGIPVPASRVFLAAELGDSRFNNYRALNAAMYGVNHGEGGRLDGGAEIAVESRAQYHGGPRHRGLHAFFLDGHAKLVQTEKGVWNPGSSVFGTASNQGYFYDFDQFEAMKSGALRIP